MVNVNSIFGSSEYLKAADLGDRDFTLTISRVDVKEFDDGNKLLIHFERADKGLVCNKTNANSIARMHGNDTDGWVGRQICLFKAWVDFRGETVEAIRVRPPSNAAAQHPNAPLVDHQPHAAPAHDLDDEIPF